MKNIHVAIASTLSRPGEVSANLAQIDEAAEQSRSVGADVLLTPELSASGYGSYPEVLATAERAGEGPIFESLAGCARRTGVILCVGFVEAGGGVDYLSHYVVRPDGSFLVQRKNYVVPAEYPLMPGKSPGKPLEGVENRTWDGEAEFQVFEIRGVRCALAICADFLIAADRTLFPSYDVDLLLAPAAAGGRREDRMVTDDLRSQAGREKYLKLLEGMFFPRPQVLHCLDHRVAIAAVNLCGYDGRRFYHGGHGAIISPFGEVLALMSGQLILDRQRMAFAHAVLDFDERL